MNLTTVLVLEEQPTDDINDSVCEPEKKFSINFINSKTKFCLSFHCNADNLYINGTKVCILSTYYFCFGSVSKDFANNEMNEISFKGTLYDFATNYALIGIENIVNIHECLMKNHNIK